MNQVGMSEFLSDLRHVITGPLDIWMEDALFDTCVQFCRQSELITLSRTITNWTTGQEIALSENFDLIACQLLRVLDAEGNPLSPGVDYHAVSPNDLTALVDIPSATVWYVAEPARDGFNAPEILLQHYRDVICAGAAAALYLMPGKPWTDVKRAAEYQARFTEGVRRAGRFRKEQSNADRVEFDNPVRTHTFF